MNGNKLMVGWTNYADCCYTNDPEFSSRERKRQLAHILLHLPSVLHNFLSKWMKPFGKLLRFLGGWNSRCKNHHHLYYNVKKGGGWCCFCWPCVSCCRVVHTTASSSTEFLKKNVKTYAIFFTFLTTFYFLSNRCAISRKKYFFF